MTELKVMGRLIGTCNGWDIGDAMIFMFYEFVPAVGVPLAECDCLNLDVGEGNFEIVGPEGLISKHDIIETLKTVDRWEP